MQPMINRITIRDLVFSNIWTRLNFFGLGGLCKAYIQSNPVSSASVNVIKGSKSWKPDGVHPRLFGVDDRITRATRIKTNSPPLATICKI